MTAKETPAHGGNREQAAETAALEGVAFSKTNSTTDGAVRQLQVADLLERGKDHGIKRTTLAELVGVNERVLRRRIQQERKAGSLILSDCEHGYFLPGSVNELRHFTRQMRHRAGEVLAVVKVAEAALARIEGQETIAGWYDG